ncbi:MAG: DNA repair protein RecN [Bdellovibrionales bacterium GWB1_55_8]|nr:MAG: DNA repair protein RecN [Bdellovibrionales bacterium GWB1_55_8]
MLQALTIRNFAIIDSAEVPFGAGLNILSGETGAGKSIVIEAIALLLGARARSEMIRSGCEEAVVEGLFDISNLPWIEARMEKLGFQPGSAELLIKRTVHSGGRHRIYVNGELATLSILQTLCDGLVDLCSQHEHQSLTKAHVQLELVDSFGGLQKQTAEFRECFGILQRLRVERENLAKSESERQQRTDFLKFQIEELRGASLQEGEDEALTIEKQLLQTAEARVQSAEGARQALENDDGGALNLLRAALQRLRALEQLDDRARAFTEGLERALAESDEVSIGLNRYLGSVDLNTERLEIIQDRLSMMADFRRKYGASVNDMLSTLARLEQEYSSLGETDQRLSELDAAIETESRKLTVLGKKLSAGRTKAAEKLSTAVTAELKDLQMAGASFNAELEFQVDSADWSASGADLIQFVVQTNRGEVARPVGKIASGGELSRLMLAVRRVISDRGGIGVYLFDEIDAGIGGQTAFQVGKKLKAVSKSNQVICITHLPQVASFAQHHLVVRKAQKGKRTLTEIVSLDLDERREELARMLGGPQLTKKSLENASELLDLARI